MLNLSDKDLDRLSQEAAQQHEPGDIIGPKFWDKLEARLDRDLGKVNPNPARGIRRLPYYYAPAVLMLLGVSYYLVRLNSRSQKGASSGSPPLTVVRPAPAEPLKPASSSQNPVSSSKNSTLSEPSNTVQYPGTAAAPPSASNASAASGTSSPSGTSGASTHPAASGRPDASTGASRDNAIVHNNASSRDNATARNNTTARNTPAGTNLVTLHHRHNRTSVHGTSSPGATSITTGTPPAGAPDALNTTTGAPNATTIAATPTTTAAAGALNATTTAAGAPTATAPRNLTYSAVRGPIRLGKRAYIDDSALRAFNLATIHQLIHKDGLRINRSLEIGILAGPDYTSVNSLAGDRPGSTIGITADYQVANHLYLGTGLLFTRKVFAAASQDYKVPPNYYRDNYIGMGGSGVDYIKGSFSMLEIPLNLRYDFSTAGNPTFFASIGTSSYLFTRENCGYYFTLYNPHELYCKPFSYKNYPDNLFATLNLSMGAEFGISNSLSAVISPYIKIPTRGIGFGQVQLSSVGIDFALRFAPVLSRKR